MSGIGRQADDDDQGQPVTDIDDIATDRPTGAAQAPHNPHFRAPTTNADGDPERSKTWRITRSLSTTRRRRRLASHSPPPSASPLAKHWYSGPGPCLYRPLCLPARREVWGGLVDGRPTDQRNTIRQLRRTCEVTHDHPHAPRRRGERTTAMDIPPCSPHCGSTVGPQRQVAA